MKTIIKLNLISVILILGCTSVQPVLKPYVAPANQIQEPALFFYNLPQTSIEFEIKIKQTQYYRGPYYQYGEKFLGLKTQSIIQNNSKEFSIVSISSKTITTPDSSQWYGYVSPSQAMASFFLNNQNVLMAINSAPSTSNQSQSQNFDGYEIPQPVELEGFFYDVSMQNMVEEEIRTVYRHIKRDSIETKIPTKETVKVQRNPEELSRLAAEFIQKIRNLRFELSAGLYETFPEGESLKISIQELYSVEQRYLQLFTGFSKDTIYTYRFVVTPDNSAQPFTQTIFYFDEIDGPTLINKKIPYRNNNRNQHVEVEVSCPINNIKSKVTFPGGIVYRIPGLCNVEISHQNKILYKTQHSINQKGTLMQLPHDVTRIPEIEIEYDPSTGNIQKIKLPDTRKK